MAKKVIVYQDGILSYSETFIKNQCMALENWEAILVGHKYIKNGLATEDLEKHLLIPKKTNYLRRLLYLMRRYLNKVDPLALKTLKDLNANLIHAHFGTSAVDIWPYAEKLKIPLLVTLHGFDITIHKQFWESGKRGRRKINYPRQLLSISQHESVHFFAVSQAIKSRAIEYGIPEQKITLSYIGVDTKKFFESDPPAHKRENIILYVGRLVEKKGATYLLDAYSKVKPIIKDTKLLIVGGGNLLSSLQEKANSLNLNDVHFLGSKTSQEIKDLMSQAKIFCLPSITAKNGDAEGLPISILEAQASGIFVVTSSSGGVGDNLIDKNTCFMFKEKDSEGLADIFMELLQHSERYTHILINQKQLINEKFQLDNCTKQLENQYSIYCKL